MRYQLNNTVPALAKIEKSNRKFEGRQVLFPMHTNRNYGYGFTAEGGTVAAAGNEETADAKIKPAYLYGHVQFTGPVLEGTKTSKGAFIEDSKFQMKTMRDNLRRHTNYMCWGDQTGTLAKFTGTDTTTSTTLTTAFTKINNTRLLRKGQIIDIISGGVLKNTAKINSIDSTTGLTIAAVTVGAAYAPVNGDLIVNSGDYNIAIMGLLGIVDDGGGTGTIQTLSRTTYPALKAPVIANSGTLRNLSFDLAQQTWDSIYDNSGVEPEELWCHSSLRREILNLSVGDVRYTPTKFYTGQKVLEFNGIPVVVDLAVPLNKLFYMNWKYLKKYIYFDFQWIERDGLILRIAGVGSNLADSWEAFYGAGFQIGTEGPALGSGRLDDITTTVTSFVINN